MTHAAFSAHRLLALSLFVVAGCNDGWKSWKDGGTGRSSSGSSWFGPSGGEEWQIECGIFSSDEHRRTAEELAGGLRTVKSLRADRVRVVHEEGRSVIYYGDYRLKRDPKSDMIVFSDEINKDVRFIRTLAPVEGQYPFLAARPVPKKVESGDPKAGPPEWNLANARGYYTLQVGVTYNTADFHERIEAAVEWARDLRSRGHEAYYYHDTNRSYVTVGTFDESAATVGPDGRQQYSEAVRALRTKEEFAYNLENGMKAVTIQPDGTRAVNQSFLVRIPQKSAGR
jgi:hypothetical protein